jgi:oxalate decarboxylase/phosphoglucose isomerase-like protein (cupin superfamily)
MLTQSTAWHDFSKASLHQVRRLKELEPVLYDRRYCRYPYLEMPVYEIYRDCCNDEAKRLLLKHDLRYDLTVMPPLLLGEEYVKTKGHDHLGGAPEIFEVLEGEACFLLERHESGKIVDVRLVRACKGDVVLVPSDCGHVMINPSSSRLVVGNVVSRDCVQTYERFRHQRGGAYFVLEGVKLIINQNCSTTPQIHVSRASSPGFVRMDLGLLSSFMSSPESFSFLHDSRNYPYETRWIELHDVGPFELSEPRFGIVIPTLNEAGGLENVLRRIQDSAGDLSHTLIVDASHDETPNIAAKLGVRVVRQQGRGKGRALRQAFELTDGRPVLVMDGDGSMRPEEMPAFVRALSSGADIAKGSRFLPGGGSQDLSAVRRIGNSLFLLLVNLLWSTRYTDLCYGYVAFTANALKRLGPYLTSTGFQIETEICIKAKKLGLRVLEVPSYELRRAHGKSKISAVRDSCKILRTIFAEWISGFLHRNGLWTSCQSRS